MSARECNFLNYAARDLWKRNTPMRSYLRPIWKKGEGHIALHLSVIPSICRPNDVHTISFDSFAGKSPNVVQWNLLGRWWPPAIFFRSNQTAELCTNDVHLLFLNPLARKLPYLVQWMPRDFMNLLMFWSHGQRSKSNCRSLYKRSQLNSFAWKFPNFTQWIPLKSRK